MAESKYDQFSCNINAHSEFSAGFARCSIKKLRHPFRMRRPPSSTKDPSQLNVPRPEPGDMARRRISPGVESVRVPAMCSTVSSALGRRYIGESTTQQARRSSQHNDLHALVAPLGEIRTALLTKMQDRL